MTANRAFKRQVRERASRTGESYTTALRHVLAANDAAASADTPAPAAARLRLAVAQTTRRVDPLNPEAFRAASDEVQSLMHRAHDVGADLVLFCEATLCFPDKQALSTNPEAVTDADWSRFPWDALDAEITRIRATSRTLRLWTVLGVQRRPDPNDMGGRPTTSLLVIDPTGKIAGVYDERMLSRSKLNYLYAAGTRPVVVDIKGIRIGLVSGLEVLFPSLFSDYEADGVDCILYATAGTPDPADANTLASPAQTLAHQNQVWIAYATPTDQAPHTPAGVIAPGGEWAAQCPRQATPAIAVSDVTPRAEFPGRVWRRTLLESLRGE